MNAVEEYDVICVGGGLGGLAAAVRAHDLGARVLILERSSMVGGVAAYSGGFCWVGANHLDNSNDSFDATERYLDYVQGSDRPVDRSLRRSYLESAVEATKWFTEAGVPLSLIRGAADLYDPSPGSTHQGRLLECIVGGAELGEWRTKLRPSVYYRTGISRDEIYHVLAGDVDARRALSEQRADKDLLTHGIGLAGGFIREALVRRGIECRLEHRVTALRWDRDRVSGVEAKGPDGIVEIRATRGVLLAVGGYGNAPDAAELEETPEWIEAAPPVVAGDGLSLGQSVGATVVRGADPFVVLGAQFEEAKHPGSEEPLFFQLLESLGFPHSLVVNRDGNRFGDESYYGSMIRGLRTFDARRRQWSNFPCYLVVDESFRKQYPLGPYPAGAEYPPEVLRADSLVELANTIGIDANGLTTSIAAYNRAAESGEDHEFGRGSLPFARAAYGDPRYPNPNLGAVITPPFYGLPLHVLGVGMSTLGLSIDSSARVLRRDGSVVQGLYATGNAAATHELKGYVTGLANARNYTYAYCAANDMLGVSGSQRFSEDNG